MFRTAEIEIVGSAEPDQIFYGGEPRGESSMRYEEDVGGVVSHSYVVTNRGPWRARRVEVIVEWPFEVENYRDHGKWLLYLLDAQVQGNGYCDTGDLANPLRLKVSCFLSMSQGYERNYFPSHLTHSFYQQLVFHAQSAAFLF